MAELTPQQIAQKWQRNASAATTSYREGIEAVNEAPGAKAAAKADKWMQNLQASRQKWQDNVGSVTLQQWRQKTLAVGPSRYSQGIEAGVPKMQSFMNDFIPFVRGVQADVNAMPDLTLEDNLNRMVANARAIAQYRR